MKRIDGKILTQKVENVFSSRNQSKDLMLSGEKERPRSINNE